MRNAFLVLAAVAVFGCDVDDRPATFEYIHTAILQPTCSTIGCHSSRSQIQNIVFDDFDVAYTTMTGEACGDVVAADSGGFISIVDAGNSPLLLALRDSSDFVRRMPPDRPLPEADVTLIETWIVDGAPCN